MATVAEDVSGTSRRDVAKFLAAHEECASDFDIRRTDGEGGKLRLVCNGCGERAGYDVGEPGLLKLIDPPIPDKSRRRRVSRDEVERWLPAPAALPWWIPNAYILAVIAVGLGMIAFGVLRPQENNRAVLGGQGPSLNPPAQPAAPAPGPATPAPAEEANKGAGDPFEDGGPDRGAKPADGPDLDTVTVLGRFQIGVPAGWVKGMGGGAVVIRPPGDDAELRVFLEPGDEGPKNLSKDAADFLEAEHPGAKISSPESFQLRGDPAVRVEARYKGGSEWATVLSESGYAYLLLCRVDSDAPGSVESGAMAAIYSFRAL